MRKLILISLLLCLASCSSELDFLCRSAKKQESEITEFEIKIEGDKYSFGCNYVQELFKHKTIQTEVESIHDVYVIVKEKSGKEHKQVIQDTRSIIAEDFHSETGAFQKRFDSKSQSGTLVFKFPWKMDVASVELHKMLFSDTGAVPVLEKFFESPTCQKKDKEPLQVLKGVNKQLIHGDASKSHNRVNVILLGDGYTYYDMNNWKAQAQMVGDGFFKFSPYKEYKDYFNVWRLDVISQESGVCETGTQCGKNTAFHGWFGCFNTARLVCADNNEVFRVVRSAFDEQSYDIIDLTLNSQRYGGAGGAIAVQSANPQSLDITVHEVGHSFGKLADEYTYGNCQYFQWPEANVDMNYYNPKWSHWMDGSRPNVGRFQGARYCASRGYRPTYDSLMRTLGQPLYEVNSEQLIKRIYNKVSLIENYQPQQSSIPFSSNQSTFSVDTLLPQPNTIKVQWMINQKVLGEGNTFTLQKSQAPSSDFYLYAIAQDKTNMVRKDEQQLLRDYHAWYITTKNIH